jgi:hypothetical protein
LNNSYVSQTSKADYDQAAAEVANLEPINQQFEQKRGEESAAYSDLAADEKKFLSYLFPLHGQEYKDATRQKLEDDKETLSKDKVAISDDEASISDYIQKKSALDQLVAYRGEYLSLTGAGVIMLNALNARISRISDMEFSAYVQETNETDMELRGIAQRAVNFVSGIRDRIALTSQTT